MNENQNKYENLIEDSFTPSNIISEKIIISNDTNFKDKVKEFLISLVNKYENFKSNRLELKGKWNNLQNRNKNKNINVYIEPEQTTIKSPTTILNAPWGTGKTYFIEQIAWYWNDPEIIKIRQEKFKNFMVIDVWTFTSSSNIINDVSITIYEALCKFININDQKKQKGFFKKIGKIILYLFPTLISITGAVIENKFPNSSAIEISSSFASALNELNNSVENSNIKDKKQEIVKLLEEINGVIQPSLIVFDNVERMGVHAWEIIKTIQQLSIFDKLLFLLPINKTQLFFNNDYMYEKKNESAIDKYITLGTYFDLKQDYLGILKKLEFSDSDAKLINRILNVQINGYNLSIRLIEWSFLNNRIKEAFDENKYNGLKKIKKIWNTNYIDEEIKIDFNELNKDYLELDSIYKSKKNMNIYAINDVFNFIPIYKKNEHLKLFENEYFDKLQDIKTEFIDKDYVFLMNFSFNWLEEWDNFINDLEKFKKHLEDVSKEIINKKLTNQNDIENIKNQNINIENKINEFEKQKDNIEKESYHTSEQATRISELNNLLNGHKNSLEKNINIINELINLNKELSTLLVEINKLIKKENGESLIVFIDEFKNLYDKFNEKDSIIKGNKNKKIMVDILNKKFFELRNNSNNIFNGMHSIFDYKPIIYMIIEELLF